VVNRRPLIYFTVSTSPESPLSPVRRRARHRPPSYPPPSPTEKDTTPAPSLQPLYTSVDLHNAVAQLLPVLKAYLRSLVTTRPSPSPSASSQPSQTLHPPPAVKLSTVATVLSDDMTRRLEEELQSICDRIVSDAERGRDEADAQFSEM
jgi:hypothetical protein